MRIRRTSQPAVPPSPSTGKKTGARAKAGNVAGRRGAITAKSMPVEPGKPQPKAGNTRGARTALRLKDLFVEARGGGIHGSHGLGNTRPRPDALRPQGLTGGRHRDGFEVEGRTPTATRPGRRELNEGNGPPRLPNEEFKKIGGGNNVGTRGSIKLK
jgi:hypothetical protein